MHSSPDRRASGRIDLMQRLESVRLPGFERELAKQHFERSERAVDFVFGAWQSVAITLAGWKARLLPSAEAQRDAYLAGAVDRFDLENRIRQLERRSTDFWSRA